MIIGNWKLNPDSLLAARQLSRASKKLAGRYRRVKVAICPPALLVGSLTEGSSSGPENFSWGTQDISWHDFGSHTGELGANLIRAVGAELALVGHSERRQAGESEVSVNHKVKAGLKAGLQIILCVGEETRDIHGAYLRVLEQQLTSALAGVNKNLLSNLLIAYEPVWAIGQQAKGAETPEGFWQNALFIKKVLAKIFPKKIALTIPIIYGGSVNATNAESFLLAGAMGLLVGRDSLSAEKFGAIIKIADKLSVEK